MHEVIRELMREPVFGASSGQREKLLFPVLRQRVLDAAERNRDYGRYVSAWPTPVSDAAELADLPYLPVSMFKTDRPLSLLPQGESGTVITSSSTTGQVPSRIVLDSTTAKTMSRSVVSILRDFIGEARRPLLLVDAPQSSGQPQLNARQAAIRSLTPFATKIDACLTGVTELTLDMEKLQAFAAAHRDEPVLLYGFTYILWFHFADKLRAAGVRLDLSQAYVLHSGGWKALVDQAVARPVFNEGVAEAVGCEPDRVLDFYGLVENVGVVYPDCDQGLKHAPVFGSVLIRDPLTMRPVEAGGVGILQVCSALPESFPGHLLLTDDLATLVRADGCRCGRGGPAFTLQGRVPEAELRGCGNILAARRTDGGEG